MPETTKGWRLSVEILGDLKQRKFVSADSRANCNAHKCQHLPNLSSAYIYKDFVSAQIEINLMINTYIFYLV